MSNNPPSSKPPTQKPSSSPESGPCRASQASTASLYVGAGLLALGSYLKDETLVVVGVALLGMGGATKVGAKRFSR